MTKNTLSDLNNHLFEQLERVSDEDLIGEELAQELDRSRVVATLDQTNEQVNDICMYNNHEKTNDVRNFLRNVNTYNLFF